jgi:hypothetical protein
VCGFLSGQYSSPLSHSNQYGKEYSSVSHHQLTELMNLILSFDHCLDNPTLLHLNHINETVEKNAAQMSKLGLSPIKQLGKKQCDQLLTLIKNLDVLITHVLEPQINNFTKFTNKWPEVEKVQSISENKKSSSETRQGFFVNTIDQNEERKIDDVTINRI